MYLINTSIEVPIYKQKRHFGFIGRAWDYLPMTMVILCGRSLVGPSAVSLLYEEFFIQPGNW